jgi:hypothetical protein
LDSLDWSRKFPVLWISRSFLYAGLGFSQEQVDALSDEDMVRIADFLEQCYSPTIFASRTRTIVSSVLEEIRTRGGQDELT